MTSFSLVSNISLGHDEKKTIHHVLMDYVDSYEEATVDARREAARDERYVHNKQWSDREIQKLRRRNQPVITFNKIGKKIHALKGHEIRTRVDPKARPRTLSGFHEDDANAASDAIRYVTDKERFDSVRSSAFEDLLIPGFCGALVELEVKERQGRKQVEIKLRHIHRDRLFWDPHSMKADFSDARFKGIVTWMDWEEATKRYRKPAQRRVLEQTRVRGSEEELNETHSDKPRKWWDAKRRRVKVTEIYYEDWSDEENDYVWMVAHFTSAGMLEQPVETAIFDEYGIPQCPLIMTSANVDDENQRYGYVRQLISPQDEINKRRSKMLHAVNVNRIIAEDGAFKSKQEALVQKAKPDGFLVVNKGYLQNAAVQFENAQDVAQGNLQLLNDAYNQMESIGPDISTLAQLPQSASGRAILARQQAGTLELEPIFENLREWQRQIYTLIWYCVRTYWTEEMWVRVTDDEQEIGYRFTGLNRRITKAQRVQELLQKGTPLPDALTAVNANITRFQIPIVQQSITQQVQQQIQSSPQAQQQAEQDPSQVQAFIDQRVTQVILTESRELQEEMTANQVALLDVDIILDTTPDTTTIHQEESERLAQFIPSMVSQMSPEQANMASLPLLKILIETLELRSKKKIQAIVDKIGQPDPAAIRAQQRAEAQQQQLFQVQMQQMHMALQKTVAEIEKLRSEVIENRADAIKKTAEAAEITGDVTPRGVSPSGQIQAAPQTVRQSSS